MTIRKLSKEEHILTRRLYEEVFPEDSQAFVDYYYTEKTKDNQIYVIEEDGDIQAMLHLNPYEMYVNGREQTAHYIVAVATRAAYRKRGYMGRLLKQALRDMYEAGETFTFLMPAAEAIYLPYDFRTVYEQKREYYRGTEDAQKGVEVYELSEGECAGLSEAANGYLKEHCQVFAIRSAAYYERLRKEYAADGGKLMLYRADGHIVDCRPYVPEEEDGHKLIMVRAVDVRRLLMSLSLKSKAAVCFRIADPVIEENNRCIFLTGTEHSDAAVTDAAEEDSEGTVTISVLSELVFGACTVEEACEKEGVYMSEHMKEEWKKIIPLSDIYINEIV